MAHRANAEVNLDISASDSTESSRKETKIKDWKRAISEAPWENGLCLSYRYPQLRYVGIKVSIWTCRGSNGRLNISGHRGGE